MTDIDNDQLQAENDRLREENAELRRELDELSRDAELDAAHAAGLAAQLRALIAEGDRCPNKGAHPLLERRAYIDARTGQPMTKTGAYPLYREAFDEAAREAGIVDPEKLRA